VQVREISAPPGLTPSPSAPIIPSAEKIKLIRNTGLSASDEQLKRALIKLSVTLQNLSNEH
jgi:hypothetical protein